jgi:carbonic anhydrase
MCQINNSVIEKLLQNNRLWAEKMEAHDPRHFERLAAQHKPKYLWIGCSDARMPANELVGLNPGEVFVHRNIANLVNSSDMNVLSIIEYAVQVLKVEHIIVNGHYGCGGVNAALSPDSAPDMVEHWIRPIKKYYLRSRHKLKHLTEKEQNDRICEINVVEQVRNICHIPVVQQAWKEGSPLSIHGFIYDIHNGLIRDLDVSISDLKTAEEFVLRKIEVAD